MIIITSRLDPKSSGMEHDMAYDILIKNGILITMDPERRVIEDGAVAIEGERIVAVGTTDEVAAAHTAAKVIDATHMVIMPIDRPAHVTGYLSP